MCATVQTMQLGDSRDSDGPSLFSAHHITEQPCTEEQHSIQHSLYQFMTPTKTEDCWSEMRGGDKIV